MVGEMDLEAGDARQRARGRADLGREVRQRREVVAHQRRLAREAITCQLHAVAGIAGEPDDDTIELLDRLGAHWPGLRIRHRDGTGRAAGTVAPNRVLRTDVRPAMMAWVNELTPADLMVLLGILAAICACSPWRRSTDALSDPARARRAGARLRSRACPRSSCRRSSCCIGILPPLLYSSAFFTSLRDLRANLRPIGLLAIGLVADDDGRSSPSSRTRRSASTWAAAFVLGAVVSPTDPIAATAIAKRLGVPRRLVVIVGGREPRQRRDRARRLPGRGRRGGQRHVLPLARRAASSSASSTGGIAVGLAVGWVVRQAAPADRRPAGRGHDLAAHRLLRLHPGRAAARLGRRRGRDRRGVSRLAHPGADDAPTRACSATACGRSRRSC